MRIKLKTVNTFQIVTDAVGGSLGLSALTALLPLIVFFAMLLGLKASAHVSGAVALAASIVVAIVGFSMPAGMALSAAGRGALFGLFPIVWVIVMAIWFYEITVASGRFEDLRKTFDLLGEGDVRIQAALIAFCFGGLLEALAGFGAPVAITATMLLALGIKPGKAITTVLVANTAPVAFGAVGIPITTAGEVGGRSAEQVGDIAQLVSIIVFVIAGLVPFVILFILDGMRGVREAGPAAAVIGVSFAVTQWLTATFFVYQLTNVIACIVSLAVTVVFLRWWKPRGVDKLRARMGLEDAEPATDLTGGRIAMALVPYAIVVAVFGLATAVPALFNFWTIHFPWPGLGDRVIAPTGAPMDTTYSLSVLGNPGSLMAISALIVWAVLAAAGRGSEKYRLPAAKPVHALFDVASRMRLSALTIVLVLALAYVMNYSGQTIAIGEFVASAGGIFTLFAPVLGWIGTAVTGSDTSANALFANLQVTAADRIGANPDLLLAANTTGGVVGKMISPQSLAIGATAVQMNGQESKIFTSVVGYSLLLLALVCLTVFALSAAPGFLVP